MEQRDRLYPKFDEQKATEASSILLKMHGGKMSRIKLIKLLYIADREAFEKWERPITYDSYYSMKEGQVLSGVLRLINQEIKNIWYKYIESVDNIYIQLHDEPIKLQKLSKAEVNLLANTYREYGHLNRFDLAKKTKSFPEYQSTTSRVKTEINKLFTFIFGEDDADRVSKRLEEKAYLDLALKE